MRVTNNAALDQKIPQDQSQEIIIIEAPGEKRRIQPSAYRLNQFRIEKAHQRNHDSQEHKYKQNTLDKPEDKAKNPVDGAPDAAGTFFG